MAGTFGYELDITKMSAEEKAEIKEQIASYNKYYWLIQKGDYYRLYNEEYAEIYKAWEFVATDKSEALVNIVVKKVQANARIKVIKLRGLEENAMYNLEGTKTILSGAALMYGGFAINISYGDYPSAQLHFVRV